MTGRGPSPRPLGIVSRPAPAIAAGAERSVIFVRGLTLDVSVGVYHQEKDAKQPLVFDVEIELAEPHRFNADKLADTINYETVVAHANAIAESGHLFLVETFAERLAAACLEDRRAASVKVRVEKPRAFAAAAAAGVEIIRRRK